MYAIKFTGGLRVSEEGELEGLDLHEHGGGAYPEITGSSHGSSSLSGGAFGSSGRPVAPQPVGTR